MTCLRSAKSAVAALSIAGAAAAMPDRIAAAETSMQLFSCTTMLRVVGVTADDVLYLRDTPSLPRGHENANKLVGIPAGAQGIEALGEAADGWRLIRYKGIIGYARSNYLSPDILICGPRLLPPSQFGQDARSTAFR
jgi:hypothetical protein